MKSFKNQGPVKVFRAVVMGWNNQWWMARGTRG